MVRNAHASVRRQNNLSQDSIYNLIEIAKETGFILFYLLLPELIIVAVHKGREQMQILTYCIVLIQLFNFVVFFSSTGSVKNVRNILKQRGLPVMRLGYDTTFNLSSECYVSFITYRHTEFIQEPTAAVLTLFHETKSQMVHKIALETLDKCIPELKNSKGAIWTADRESAIINEIMAQYPNLPLLLCYIHALRNIKLNLRRFGIRTKVELKQFKVDFLALLNTNSKEEYNAALIPIMAEWSDKCKVSLHKIFFKYYFNIFY